MKGYTEVLNFMLCSWRENFDMLNHQDGKSEAVVVGNPLSSDFEIVRTRLMPGVLKAGAHNQHHPKPIKVQVKMLYWLYLPFLPHFYISPKGGFLVQLRCVPNLNIDDSYKLMIFMCCVYSCLNFFTLDLWFIDLLNIYDYHLYPCALFRFNVVWKLLTSFQLRCFRFLNWVALCSWIRKTMLVQQTVANWQLCTVIKVQDCRYYTEILGYIVSSHWEPRDGRSLIFLLK